MFVRSGVFPHSHFSVCEQNEHWTELAAKILVSSHNSARQLHMHPMQMTQRE